MTDQHETTGALGWPDKDRLGVPADPERDGWHWVQWPNGGPPFVAKWRGRGWVDWRAGYLASAHRYLGPCLTPAEVAEREQAAAAAMREACEQAACAAPESLSVQSSRDEDVAEWTRENVCDAIREVPAEACTLDARIAQARREGAMDGLRLAAQWHGAKAVEAGVWRAWGGPSDRALQATEKFHKESEEWLAHISRSLSGQFTP